MKTESGFEKMRKRIGMVMGPLCALLIWLMPIEDISASAHHMLAIMSDYGAGAHPRDVAVRSDAVCGAGHCADERCL